MTNAEKIALIKHYLEQENCAGVDVRYEDYKYQGIYQIVIDDIEKYSFGKYEQIIGDPKPIAIELDPLEVGAEVWYQGDKGIVTEVDAIRAVCDVIFDFEVDELRLPRHELIKATSMKEWRWSSEEI